MFFMAIGHHFGLIVDTKISSLVNIYSVINPCISIVSTSQ